MTDPLSHPLDFSDRRLVDLRGLLAASIYRASEIEEIVKSAGVPPQNVGWDQAARLLWMDVLTEAARQQKAKALLDSAIAVVPALEERIGEILSDDPVLEAEIPKQDAEADPAWKNFQGGGRERQIVEGDRTLLDISFLERGLERARAVCRLTVKMDSGSYYGTGFRIGPTTILTNHHVLWDWDHGDAPARSCLAEFGFETDIHGTLLTPHAVECDVTNMRGDRAHDFAVIETSGAMPDTSPQLGLAPSRPVAPNDRVLIIQHPQGMPKKIAMAHNLVRFADDDVVQYWTDTLAGSSGSPVFNERWEVVALHHLWVDAPPDDGTAYRNQGRNIRRVAERLAALGAD